MRREHARPTYCRCPDCTGRWWVGVIVSLFAVIMTIGIAWAAIVLVLTS